MREVMEGRMEGKITRGRPRKGMLDEFLEDGSYAQMKRIAHDRVGGVGCRGPALGQSTDDDDDDELYHCIQNLIVDLMHKTKFKYS